MFSAYLSLLPFLPLSRSISSSVQWHVVMDKLAIAQAAKLIAKQGTAANDNNDQDSSVASSFCF